MKYTVLYETDNYLRFHVLQFDMNYSQADELEYYFEEKDYIDSVTVNERTGNVLIHHHDRNELFEDLERFAYGLVNPDYGNSRELIRQGEDRIFWHIMRRGVTRFFLPASFRNIITALKSVRFIGKGLKSLWEGHLQVEVLDATAITAAMATGDFNSAGSIMFLLGLSEILEDWTRKKSVNDLARSLTLNVDKVWKSVDGMEIQVPVSDIKAYDVIIVRNGDIIPLDGIVLSGEISVNQSSMTGESLAVTKNKGVTVYAGTVVEEGQAHIRVTSTDGNGHYDQIVRMINNSEKLKSSLEDQAFSFSDRMVPVSLLTTALVYLFTRDITKAMSVLMVDYSCALKLSMPIAVLSAMQQAGNMGITVKGGKYLENYGNADTVIFDKTGTLTYSQPTVAGVIPFSDRSENELLNLAACMEEHYPHSIANAVVAEARRRDLDHNKELHGEIQYVVAHGVSAIVNGEKALLGSYHFIFEDNKCKIPDKKNELFNSLPAEYSRLYLSINGTLEAVICIEDPVRTDAADVISQLKQLGLQKTVMLTGDNFRTAEAVAARTGIDEFHAEVLPEDKARYVLQEKENNRTVVMLGDGINDSPALSAADVGIAISDGAPIARQVADITVRGNDLSVLTDLRKLSVGLDRRVRKNYRLILGFNSALIIGGILGILTPATAAYLHNFSTLGISFAAMQPIRY